MVCARQTTARGRILPTASSPDNKRAIVERQTSGARHESLMVELAGAWCRVSLTQTPGASAAVGPRIPAALRL